MRKTISFHIINPLSFKHKLIYYAHQFEYFMILDSSGYPSTYPFLAALDASNVFYPKTNQSFDELFQWHQQCNDWLFGHVSYDVKNETEALSSSLPDFIKFPLFSFFQPVYIVEIVDDKAIYHISNQKTAMDAERIHKEILSTAIDESLQIKVPSFHKRISKQQYVETFSAIKQHIQLGDIYEINYCQEFYNEHFTEEPAKCFVSLLHHSPMPFSAFYRHKQNHLLCASPERYIKKKGSQIISQPIKGTVKRGKNQDEDNLLKSKLEHCEKERAENIMIVDLVRNDLSRTAQKNSVEVTELCKVFEFPTVFQMISTVQSQLKQGVKFTDVLKTTFPMGSMTGTPKIRAMELIEKYESVRRGLFSGSVGYITPSGDFDFNVVIRSLQINTQDQYASFITGGAITIKSDSEQEYEECFVKAQGLLNAFNADIN